MSMSLDSVIPRRKHHIPLEVRSQKLSFSKPSQYCNGRLDLTWLATETNKEEIGKKNLVISVMGDPAGILGVWFFCFFSLALSYPMGVLFVQVSMKNKKREENKLNKFVCGIHKCFIHCLNPKTFEYLLLLLLLLIIEGKEECLFCFVLFCFVLFNKRVLS
jgi:hypothetical protein